MKLGTRMVLFGALVPAALLVGSFVAIGVLLDAQLREQLDEALLTQAAIESVSLFDSPDGTPHLHLASSPLADRVAGFAAAGALYDPRGRRVLQHPEGVRVPERMVPRHLERSPRGQPIIENDDARDNRELTMTVVDGGGSRYVLWLGLPLEGHRETIRSYYRLAAGFSLAALLLLLPLSIGQSRQIARRLGRLAAHMRKLRDGNFDAPPADSSTDVLGELRASIADTTRQLGAAAESQDRFIAEAAHELRTPLASLRTTIDVALRRERSADELREVLTSAHGEVKRLSALATSLLDLAAARRGSIQRSAVDLRALVEEAVDAARTSAELRDVLIEVNGAEDATAMVAEFQVRQALDNLLANAIRHSPHGTTVRVAIEAKNGPTHGWTLIVEDEGAGVAREERERIFAPFYQAPSPASLPASEPTHGAGLGLALVREITARHGGSVHVEETQNGGARFVLALEESKTP